jgi:hypothetical protein
VIDRGRGPVEALSSGKAQDEVEAVGLTVSCPCVKINKQNLLGVLQQFSISVNLIVDNLAISLS